MTDSLLVAGIAQLLEDTGVATWDPSGATYPANVVGIYQRRIPSDRDAALSLSTYVVSDAATLSDSITGLQVHGRTAGADARTTDDLMDAVFNQLQGLAEVDLNTGIRVVFCKRQSGVSLGQDELLRWARADNYYVSIWRPSPNRT
jgi:hypothetical protein